MPINDIHDAIGIKQISPNVYESLQNPDQMGNARSIAYGGCALAIACVAAHQGIPDGHRLYTMSGNYLGPALIDRKLLCRVQPIRRTRTFTTNLVTVSQTQDGGRPDRDCLVALVDFQAIEPASLLTYSRPPTQAYKPPEQNPTWDDIREKLLSTGAIDAKVAAAHKVSFGLSARLFDARLCEEGVFAQNLTGALKTMATTQDDRAVYDKVSADWWRARAPLSSSRAEHASVLIFLMDGALSFAPLSHSHRFFDDAGACSSLDFSLRVFSNDFDVNQWSLREIRTHFAAGGRTYSEGTCWDREGRAICSMTQQSIMRPPAEKKAKL